ncbi:hypothetical protein R1flu_000842 [Riccia fluitans]|uniref:Uncharacterized protein n=1 Tax=Riccia fluitans TaxID=41844 RepID=A0ABD1Y1M7_9MARC
MCNATGRPPDCGQPLWMNHTLRMPRRRPTLRIHALALLGSWSDGGSRRYRLETGPLHGNRRLVFHRRSSTMGIGTVHSNLRFHPDSAAEIRQSDDFERAQGEPRLGSHVPIPTASTRKEADDPTIPPNSHGPRADSAIRDRCS